MDFQWIFLDLNTWIFWEVAVLIYYIANLYCISNYFVQFGVWHVTANIQNVTFALVCQNFVHGDKCG